MQLINRLVLLLRRLTWFSVARILLLGSVARTLLFPRSPTLPTFGFYFPPTHPPTASSQPAASNQASRIKQESSECTDELVRDISNARES